MQASLFFKREHEYSTFNCIMEHFSAIFDVSKSKRVLRIKCIENTLAFLKFEWFFENCSNYIKLSKIIDLKKF